MSTSSARGDLRKAIGPGILVACAAIGGSHLVWSTRAGADFGWKLAGLILLANLLKFPFFLYGQRYTPATGESLLDGYRREGRFSLLLFLFINILTGVINIAGVAMVSGALLDGFGLFPGGIAERTIGVIIICALMILLGQYKFLDGLSKAVIIVLSLSTFAAVALAMTKGSPIPVAGFIPQSPWHWEHFPFLVFLLGWMPAPIDLSAWSSLWMFSRSKQTGHFATARESSIDFYLGYIMTVALAIAFMALGKLIMFGTGESFSESGIAFSNQLIGLYAASIGNWARPIIITAAFVTMFSTTLTCLDGYPRSLAACCKIFRPGSDFRRIHQFWIVVSAVTAIIIVRYFAKSLITHLAFAATVSFLTSPFLAAINFKIMYGANVPAKNRPGLMLALISWAGIFFFVAMAIGYIYVQFYRDNQGGV